MPLPPVAIAQRSLLAHAAPDASARNNFSRLHVLHTTVAHLATVFYFLSVLSFLPGRHYNKNDSYSH
jgi:hypothetical protein